MFHFCFYISVARWNWCTGEISRCRNWIISIHLMTVRLVLFLFSRFGPCNDRTTSISSASDNFSSNSLFTRVVGIRIRAKCMKEEKLYFWLILVVIVGSFACWMACVLLHCCVSVYLCMCAWLCTGSGFIVHFQLSFGSNELGNKWETLKNK